MISYNFVNFFMVKLNDFVNCCKLVFWVYVEYLSEEDEKKAYKYFYIVSNG